MKPDISRKIFKKYSNIRFHENLSSGNRVVPCGQTDRQDIANICFLQFCEREFLFSKVQHQFQSPCYDKGNVMWRSGIVYII